MNSARSILSATDLSAPSRHASVRAAMLARANGVAMTLMHAVRASGIEDMRRWLAGANDAADAVEADALQRLQAQAAELGRRHGVDVRAHLAVGRPVEELVRHANDIDAGWLVTGTRGAGFMRGVVFGSTAERVASRSTRPVLMVRNLPHEPYRRILVPVDFSPWSRLAIDLARQIAPDAALVLMHAVEVPFEGRMRLAGVTDAQIRRYRDAARQEAAQRLADLAAAAGLPPGSAHLATPDGADPWMLIVQESEEQDCDLVVIGRQGRHAIDEFFLGSTTRSVIAEGATDVLISTRWSA